MKKMKRFLSLLICMVMLMSVLPMGASAAEITQVVITLQDTTDKDIDQAVASITATPNKGTLGIWGDKNWVEENGEVTVSFLLYPINGFPHDPDPEFFKWKQLKVVASGFEQDDLSYKVVDDHGWKYLGITMKFPKPHKHEWSGWKDAGDEGHYKECSCTETTGNEDHVYGEDGTALVCSLCNHNRGVTVTFVNNKGTAPEAQNIVKGTAASNPGTPACDIAAAYTFDAWYLGDDEFDFDTLITVPITLTAKWTPNMFDIVFVNDGTEVSRDELPYGDPIVVPETPKKEGYTFDGWGEVPPTVPAEDKTFTAQWIVNDYEYNVVYVSSTGVALGTDKVTKPFGSTHSISAPAKGGYTAPASQDVTWDSTKAKTITFTYTPVEYDVTFNLDGGTGVSDRKYTIETEDFTLNHPDKTGYTFLGWTETGVEGSIASKEVTIKKGSTEDKSYTANWEIDTYSITYVDAEGVENPESYNVETETFTLNNPTKENYEFLGWTETGVEGSVASKKVTIAKGSTGDKSYTANWAPIDYTIGYDLAGGTVATDNPATYNVETETFTLNNPTKEHYEFLGWTGSNGETAQKTVTIEQGKTTGAKSYTANWAATKYKIAYYDGLTKLESLSTTYTVEDETFNLPVLAESGKYTFVGWCENANLTGNTVTKIEKGTTGDKIFYAKWTETPAVANIDVKPDDKQIYVGDTLQFTADVTVVGNISKEVKWSIAPASGIALLSADETTINENTGLLTANKPGKYIVTATSRANPDVYGTEEVEVLPLLTVKFDTNGKGTAPKDQNLKAGEKAVKPADPTAANYTFGGWYADKDCTIAYVFDTEVENNITLYAKWTKTIYKVTYDANGGTGEMPIVNVEAGEGHTLVANEFKAPTGKTFKCWRVGLKDYKAGEKIDVTENVTVKAIWKNKTASSDLDYVPAAGDNFPTFLWAGLLLFSVVALVEVVVLRRKRS